MPPQVGLGGPRQSSDPPPPFMGFELLLLWNGQMTMGFGTVQETVILTPRTLSFSLVFFIYVTAQWTRPDLPRSRVTGRVIRIWVKPIFDR